MPGLGSNGSAGLVSCGAGTGRDAWKPVAHTLATAVTTNEDATNTRINVRIDLLPAREGAMLRGRIEWLELITGKII